MTLFGDDPLGHVQAKGTTPYAATLGIRYTRIETDRVEAEIDITTALCTLPDGLHGGAIMSLADDMGAVGTIMNLPEGARTSTIESKTNFLRGLPSGETATAVSTPVHLGRTTMVWRTEISRADGKLAAVVTQTQIVLPA